MYSQFPFSMDNIPRQKGFACLSLKFGSIVSALIIILYSVLSLAQCVAALGDMYHKLDSDNVESLLMFGLVVTVTVIHSVTLFLTAIMLVGTLREKPDLIRPWVMWTSIQVMTYLMMFVYWTTVSMLHRGGGNTIVLYALEFLTLLLRFYMLMLVASYYKQLKEERLDGERLKTLISKEMWYNSA